MKHFFTLELMMASTFDLMGGRYTAWDTGEIYSNLSGRMLSPGRNSKGYYTVQLYDGSVPKKPKSHLVHRLICIAFHGEPPLPNSQVNHKDGNKANNAAGNLEWTTPLENVRHGIEVLGKAQFGEKSPRCKIAADKMPIMMDRSLSCAEAGRRLGCSGAYVSQVRRGLYRTQG